MALLLSLPPPHDLMDFKQAPLFHKTILQATGTNKDALTGPERAETSGTSVEDPRVSCIARVLLPAHEGGCQGSH